MTSRGGKRTGAGRKPGAVTSKTRQVAEKAIEAGVTPLDFMLSVMRDEKADQKERFEAAKAAAPYVHARLAAVEVNGPDGGPVPVEVIRRVIVDPQHPDA